MKKSILTLLIIQAAIMLVAQVPEKLSYQAVVRNNSGEIVANTTIGMRISIQKWIFAIPKPYYTSVYAETHTPTTNENGLVNIAVGAGSVIAGSVNFADINWSAENYYIRTDIDVTGGNAYSITSTTQILSVPYAFTAKTALKTDTAAKAGIADMAESLDIGGIAGKIYAYSFNSGDSPPLLISAEELGLSASSMINFHVLSLEVGWADGLQGLDQFRGIKDGITYEIYLSNNNFQGVKIYFPDKFDYYDKPGRIIYMLID